MASVDYDPQAHEAARARRAALRRYFVVPQEGATFTAYSPLATSYQEAADKAARRIGGKRAWALRTTGTVGMSGYFQAYRALGGGESTSVGAPFPVRLKDA
jgi:hypothetical protein